MTQACPEKLDSCRLVMSGGEALPLHLGRRWASALASRGAHLVNVYGPTEATIWATCHLIDESAAAIAIGRALPGLTCLITDEERIPISEYGVEGELVIGGVGVARGYLRRRELTAERFIAPPPVRMATALVASSIVQVTWRGGMM